MACMRCVLPRPVPPQTKSGLYWRERLVGDPERGRVREAVRVAGHEVLERVGGVQAAGPAPRLRGHLLRIDGGTELPVRTEADLAVSDAGEAGRLGDLLGVGLGDVVDEEGRPHLDEDRVGGLGFLPGVPEPGVELALVDAGLQVLEDLGPGRRLFPQDVHRCA